MKDIASKPKYHQLQHINNKVIKISFSKTQTMSFKKNTYIVENQKLNENKKNSVRTRF